MSKLFVSFFGAVLVCGGAFIVVTLLILGTRYAQEVPNFPWLVLGVAFIIVWIAAYSN